MSNVPRIRVDTVREKVQSGEALLVCAYADDEKCARARLDGAITLNELRRRQPSLPKSQELIFYCG